MASIGEEMNKTELYALLRDPELSETDKKLSAQVYAIAYAKWSWTVLGGVLALGVTWGAFVARNVTVSDKVDRNEIKLESTCKQVNAMELSLKGIETKQDMMLDLLKRRDR
jgi:hypothetical protein